MENIIAQLDRVASTLESFGLTKNASYLDSVSLTLERTASVSDLARARLFKSCGMALYVDMDGVLTDFVKHYSAFGGGKISKGSDIDWALVDNLEFWQDMPWKKDGKSLWKALAPFDPIILTTPTTSDVSKVGKREWVSRELGDNTRIIMDTQKWQYASPVAVLVDDMDKNIGPWELYKGIGILHKTTGETLKEFRKAIDVKCKELA